jgi:DNA-directed RNA polymerase II subunit RPB2
VLLYSRDKVSCIICQVDVNTEVGVVRDIRLKELRLYTDYGRCSRPLFIVEKQRLLIKKQDVRALQMKVRNIVFNELCV